MKAEHTRVGLLALLLLVMLGPGCSRSAQSDGPRGGASAPASALSPSAPSPSALRPGDVEALPAVVGSIAADPLSGRGLDLLFGGGAGFCTFGAELRTASCRSIPAGPPPTHRAIVESDDDAPLSIHAGDPFESLAVHDAATGAQLLSVPWRAPRGRSRLMRAYRRVDGTLVSLPLEPHEPREQQAARVELRIRSAAGEEIHHPLGDPFAGTVEAGRILGDWLLLSEASSTTRHRIVGRRLLAGGAGERVVLGEIPSRRAFRSGVDVDGPSCRSGGAVFAVVSAESEEKGMARERALAVLAPERRALVPLEEDYAFGPAFTCRGEEAVFTGTAQGRVGQLRCTTRGCRESWGRLPLSPDEANTATVASFADGILVVSGERPVTMRFAPLDRLADAPAVPIYRSGEGETVNGIHLFVRSEAAVAVLRTSRGALAIRIDPAGAFSPVRPVQAPDP